MQISQTSILNTFSSNQVVSVVPNQLPKGDSHINGLQLPDFNSDIFYNKEPEKLTDEEFKDLIINQAKQDYENDSFHKSQGYKQLERDYITPYSPDRESIITSGVSSIFSNAGLSSASGDSAIPQYDIWWLALLDENKNGLFTLNDTASYGGVSFKVENGQASLNYAEFYDEKGNLASAYTNGQWVNYSTPEESARAVEFREIYNNTWRALENGEEVVTTLPPVETKPAPLPENSTFEVRA